MIVLKVLIVLMAVASYASVVNGICCNSCPKRTDSTCPDGTSCTPFWTCCATGGCNIFCCNCDGVCRRSSFLQSMLPWAKTAADNLDVAIERFDHFDADKNGAIDIKELKQADAISMPAYVLESAFRKIDVNRDSKITIEEFDEDAGRFMKEKLQ